MKPAKRYCQWRRVTTAAVATFLLLCLLSLLFFSSAAVAQADDDAAAGGADAGAGDDGGEAAAETTTNTLSRKLWIGGPAETWVYANTHLSALLLAGVTSDLQTALASCDANTKLSADSVTLTPYNDVTEGPATGLGVAYTVTTTTMTAEQLDTCVRASPLGELNTKGLQTLPTLQWLVAKSLPVNAPADLSSSAIVTGAMLPLRGSANAWKLWLSLMSSQDVGLQGALTFQLQQDLQNAVDAGMKNYMVVVTGGLTASLVNASSYYVPYSIWKLPKAAAAGDAAAAEDEDATQTAATALQSRIAAAPLPLFNAVFNTYFTLLATQLDATAVRSYFPDIVTPWAPVLDSVATHSWISGPPSVWTAATTLPLLPVAMAADLATALQSCAPGAAIYVSAIDPYTAKESAAPAQDAGTDKAATDATTTTTTTTTTLVTGTAVTYTVANTSLSAEALQQCARQSTLPHVNGLFKQVTGNYTINVRAIGAADPAAMAVAVRALLPLSGASYGWQIALTAMAALKAEALAVFFYQLQTDLQDAVDTAMTSSIVTVTTDVKQFVVNASSFYASYTVWQPAPQQSEQQQLAALQHEKRETMPTQNSTFAIKAAAAAAAAAVPSTETVQSRVMASTLPHFNAAFTTLLESDASLSAYRAFFPSSILPHVPLQPNPAAAANGGGEENGEGASVTIIDRQAGDYLLTFAGSAETWKRIWSTQQLAVSTAIVTSATARLSRRTVVNTVTVVSARTMPNEKKYVGGLQVVCHVEQGVTPSTDRTWSPEEVASILRQADYTTVEALYTASSKVAIMAATETRAAGPGALATSGIAYDYTQTLHTDLIGIIGMSAAIGFLCLVAVLVTVVVVCCCRRRISTRAKQDPLLTDGETDSVNAVVVSSYEEEAKKRGGVAAGKSARVVHATEVMLASSSSSAGKQKANVSDFDNSYTDAAAMTGREVVRGEEDGGTAAVRNPLARPVEAAPRRISVASSDGGTVMAFQPPADCDEDPMTPPSQNDAHRRHRDRNDDDTEQDNRNYHDHHDHNDRRRSSNSVESVVITAQMPAWVRAQRPMDPTVTTISMLPPSALGVRAQRNSESGVSDAPTVLTTASPLPKRAAPHAPPTWTQGEWDKTKKEEIDEFFL